jgi:hypothetical protein
MDSRSVPSQLSPRSSHVKAGRLKIQGIHYSRFIRRGVRDHPRRKGRTGRARLDMASAAGWKTELLPWRESAPVIGRIECRVECRVGQKSEEAICAPPDFVNI